MEFKSKIIETLYSLNAPASALAEVSAASDEVLKTWIRFIDESPDSLKDWCSAYLEFKKWESKENRPLSLAHKIEYLSCCREGGGSSTLISLSDLFLSYVEEYGVE